MDKVKSGEIDLIGGMIYSETLINDYDYSATNYGMGNMAIYVDSNNAEINDTNIYSLKNLNVGIISTKKEVNVSLKDFGDINGININQYFYDNGNDLQTALDNNEIDAIVLSDLSVSVGDYRVVARFSPRPFYFATTKGNSELMSQLNEAMTMLNKEQPNYMSNLHEKYFSMANNDFILTTAENQFIKNNPKISVLILGGKAPLQYYNDKKGGLIGITVDVLDHISKLSGITFDYIYAETNKDYESLLEKKKPMLIGGVTTGHLEGYRTTKAYFNSGVSLVANKNINISDLKNKKAAVVRTEQLDDLASEEVVVTGTRNETDIRHLPMTISVVGRQNLEHTYQPSVLPALTEQVPGLFTTGRGIMESDCSDRNKMNLPAILMFGRIYKVGCL